MKEQLKASVLAKIGGMSYEEELENGWEYERRHYDGRSWHRLHKGCITYDFDHWDTDDDPVWDLAADLLGIKPKEERPSDALLTEAFQIGRDNTPMIGTAKFGKWLATLPADPLKADRETIKKMFDHDSFERDLLNDGYAYRHIDAIMRLAGMEVQNG